MLIFSPSIIQNIESAAAKNTQWPPIAWESKAISKPKIVVINNDFFAKWDKQHPMAPAKFVVPKHAPNDPYANLETIISSGEPSNGPLLDSIHHKMEAFWESFRPDYNKIDALEESGQMVKADEYMMQLYHERVDGECPLGSYMPILMHDLEHRNEFAQIISICQDYKHPGPLMEVVEAGCAAHLGLVFNGERAALEQIAKANVLVWSDAEGKNVSDWANVQQDWDRGDDPKSIELFAWQLYGCFPNPLAAGEPGPGEGDSEHLWVDRMGLQLDPSDVGFFMGALELSYATDPAGYLKLMKLRFPNGYPKNIYLWCDGTERACKALINLHQVFRPTYKDLVIPMSEETFRLAEQQDRRNHPRGTP